MAAPVAALKVFSAQAVNAPPFGPVYPAFAMQAVWTVEPAGLLLFVGQAVKGPPLFPK